MAPRGHEFVGVLPQDQQGRSHRPVGGQAPQGSGGRAARRRRGHQAPQATRLRQQLPDERREAGGLRHALDLQRPVVRTVVGFATAFQVPRRPHAARSTGESAAPVRPLRQCRVAVPGVLAGRRAHSRRPGTRGHGKRQDPDLSGQGAGTAGIDGEIPQRGAREGGRGWHARGTARGGPATRGRGSHVQGRPATSGKNNWRRASVSCWTGPRRRGRHRTTRNMTTS